MGFDELRAAVDAVEAEVLNDKQMTLAVVSQLRLERDAAVVARDVAAKALEDYIATHQPPLPVSSGPLMGMSTDDWAARVAETGPVEAHRVFVPTFSVTSIINKIKEDHARGVTPYWSTKFPGTWAQAASGVNDAAFKTLGVELGKLDYVTYGCFHHEPRDKVVKTPQQLIPWSQANARVIPLVRAGAGPKHKLGTTDNGFPWGVKDAGSALTDAELAVYYTSALLNVCDFLGGDFYDGATDTNIGEPAAVKMAKFEEWAKRIGFKGSLAVGEWNAVKAEDIFSAWSVLKEGPWAIACLFNSAENNRTNLPTSLGGSWVLRGDRLAAFRAVLAEAM